MKIEEVRYQLQRTTRKYLFIRVAEIFIGALALGLVVFAVCRSFTLSLTVSVITAVIAGAICFIAVAIRKEILYVTTDDLIQYINREYPQLEESGDLLARDANDLSALQRLQQIKTIQVFEGLYSEVRLPVKISRAIVLLVISAVITVTLLYFFNTRPGNVTTVGSGSASTTPDAKVVLPAGIESVSVSIYAPGYTRIPKKEQRAFNLTVPEGSTVTWSVRFSQPNAKPRIIYYGKDTLSMTQLDRHLFTAKRSLTATGFYQLAWRNTDGSNKYSDYFQIEVNRDLPPVVKIDNLDQFIELSMEDDLRIDLRSSLTDDYGLDDAFIIATVSKGSGEAVKFREEKLRFEKPARITGKSVAASLRIDIPKLGLDPGDELYFYVEAHDNKTPQFNKSRTETYFISLQDTAQMTTSVDPGLGVDLMPEYFRSQRQIIIDTEKLLKQKKSIAKQEFNSKSNELGYDEKVLRLRYGEFLGEEFETSIGPSDHGHPEEGEEDVMKQYGHQHDTEKEHASAVEDKPHAHNEDDKKDEDDPAKAYMHAHDSEEEATFFNQSIRSKLKAAVSVMWDAELHLRLFEPEKSLPFQYKALKLLKEISQDSRIYVHRTGFDPPPLKEEKRLTGELSEAGNSTANRSHGAAQTFPAIRQALAAMEAQAPDDFKVTPQVKSLLMKAGNEMSAVALQQPARYLKSLSMLKALSEDELKGDNRVVGITRIRAAFYSILPVEPYKAKAGSNSSHPMDDEFLRKLNELSKQVKR